jgi:L-ascorbate metabolism protein UlaG (beta-lactamase superfamily)
MTGLIDAIDSTEALEPTLWWLGRAGFAVKYFSIVFYVDPWLPPAIDASEITNADMVLRTHFSADAEDPTRLILEASPRAKVIVHKDSAETLKAAGIGFHRMTTTDAGLRVEYFKSGAYGRVYSVPARPAGLGYLIRFGQCTIYHPGVSTIYEGLAEQLKPYNVTVALLPIGEKGFSPSEAASIQAEWLVPMNCDPETIDRFTNHFLGHHPTRRFKIFKPEESWAIPTR